MTIINIFGEEEFRPIIKFEKVFPKYYVSKDSKIFSSKSNKFLTPYKTKDGYLEINLNVPDDLFDDYQYNKTGACQQGHVRVHISVHRAVMNAWKPIDKNPPEQLKDTWNGVPEEWRQWVRDTVYIDHIDDNPSNNHVDNLRYVTPKENSNYRKMAQFSSEQWN